MRYIDTRTGATLEPSSQFVADQMSKNPAYKPVEDAKPKPTRKRRTTKAAE